MRNFGCETVTIPQEVDMHDIKERLSVLWIFALLNYLSIDKYSKAF